MILRFFDLRGNTTQRIGSKVWMLAALGASSVSSALAQEVQETPKEITVQEEADPFSGRASLSYRTSTMDRDENIFRNYLTAGLSLQYDFPEYFALGLGLRGNQDLVNERVSSMTEATLSLSRSWQPNEEVGLGSSFYYGAPVSKDMIKYSNSKGTVGVDGSVSYQFPSDTLKGTAVSASLALERYIYQYEYTNGGSILDKWALMPSVSLSYTYAKTSLSVSYTNITAWDFEGDQENDSFLLTETLSYKHDDHWSFNVGHTNDGLTYDYLGAANNVRFYDKRRSQVFFGGSYGF